MVVPVPPEELLTNLLSAARHPQKVRNLHIIDSVCKRLFDSRAANWSLVGIAAASEELGGPRYSSLRLAQSADYRALINSWKCFQERTSGKLPRDVKARASGWTDYIEDPALKHAVLALQADLVRARADLANLRASGSGKIEVVLSGEVQQAAQRPLLLPSERRALERLADTSWLERRGLKVLTTGELVHVATGEVFADSGWITGLKKLLLA